MIEEIIKDIQLPPESIPIITERFSKLIKEIEASANTNVNKILDKVAENFETKFGVPRLASETKISDYISRGVDVIGQNSIKKSEDKIKELELKLKENIGQDELKKKVSELSTELENERKKINEVENQYNNKITSFKIDSILKQSIPVFDPVHNKFELKIKTEDALNNIKQKYDLKFNESDELIAEDKNTFQKYKISNLLNESLKEYLPKENNSFPNAKPPVNAPQGKLIFTKDMDGKQKRELVISHLMGTGQITSILDSKYSKLFELVYKEASKNII